MNLPSSLRESIQKEALAARLSVSSLIRNNDDHIREALEVASRAERLIPGEIERLRSIPLDNEIDALTVDYYCDLVQWQLEHISRVAVRRLDYLDRLDLSGGYLAEKEKCAKDTVHWFRQWAWTYDPRPDSPINDLPFDPFDFQVDFINWLERQVFLYRKGGLIEKSRDMGISWSVLAWNFKQWLFVPGYTALLGSRKEDFVDKKGDMGSLFEKLRYQARYTPEWMLPEGFDPLHKDSMPYMKLVNPETGAALIGESSNANFGRGGRYTAAFLDEFAAFPSGGREAYAALSQSTRSIFPVSTPKGKDNKFAELRFDSTKPKDYVFTLHWKRHIWKAGVSGLDDRWYRIECSKMNKAEIAQEIDLDYEASLSGRIFSEWDEKYHVITWSEFADYFGRKARDEQNKPRIPADWYLGRGLDWGTTLEHPTAVVWVARPAEYDPLADCVFVYRELVRPLPGKEDPITPLRIARPIVELQRPYGEESRFSISIMSHEATSEMEAFQLDMPPGYRLSFSKWKPDTTDGIGVLQNYLQINPQRRHPFRPQLDGDDHKGSPRIFFVVSDGQGALIPDGFGGHLISRAIDDDGLARLRAEIPQFHYPKTSAGLERDKPHALFNDAIDALRKVAANWFPPAAQQSAKQLRESKIPEHLKEENIAKLPEREAGMAFLTRQILIKEKNLDYENDTGQHWRDRLFAA